MPVLSVGPADGAAVDLSTVGHDGGAIRPDLALVRRRT
jgi:hypothetical protein